MAAHIKTKDRSKLVMNLKAFGCDDAYIARQLECHPEELRTLYQEELRDGPQSAVAAVAARLLTIATTGDARVAVPAIMFWLKTQAGWVEPQKQAEAAKNAQNLNFSGRDELLDELAAAIDKKQNAPKPN